jgi:uracil-DNA glycosylase
MLSSTNSNSNSNTNTNFNKKKFINIINPNWIQIFNEIDKDIYEITEDSYNELLENKTNIFPTYKNIFNFTNYCIPEEIKVVILGQDPYHGIYFDSKTKSNYPQATGISFSVPKGCQIPPSLQNIYSNLLKFSHIVKIPPHGNLEFLAYQGILFLNTSLTVTQSKPNSHQNIWFEFTDELIKIISKKFDNLIFVLWGSNAIDKLKIITNKSTHKFIISSPLSAYKSIKQYPSFMEMDHFGLINKYIDEFNEFNESDEFKKNIKYIEPIVWNIF